MNTDFPLMDPTRDLFFERIVDVSPALVWRVWTEPAHLMKWFCPVPWPTTECEIDLRPGGRFRTVMQGPNGERFDNVGCYLEVVAQRRLTWTSALEPGYRPAPPGGPLSFPFTATVTMEPQGSGTRYRALAMHRDAESRKQHADMGFEEGWGKALDQLVAHVKTL
jgi:uncharacterized protein YndB with AHSA1/START domain